jgi:hypothetical protein
MMMKNEGYPQAQLMKIDTLGFFQGCQSLYKAVTTTVPLFFTQQLNKICPWSNVSNATQLSLPNGYAASIINDM